MYPLKENAMNPIGRAIYEYILERGITFTDSTGAVAERVRDKNGNYKILITTSDGEKIIC